MSQELELLEDISFKLGNIADTIDQIHDNLEEQLDE